MKYWKNRSLNSFFYCLFIGCFLLLLNSCTKRKDQKQLIDELIQQELLNRIAVYKETRQNKCMEALFQEASEIADSILLLEARNSRDSSDKPPIPNKPLKPEIIAVNDTTPIEPFLNLKDSTISSIATDSIIDKINQR